MTNETPFVNNPFEFNNTADLIKLEKINLRKRCNLIGFMVLLASVVFLVFSFMASFTFELIKALYPVSGVFNEASDSIPLNLLTGFINVVAVGVCGTLFIKLLKGDDKYPIACEKVSFTKILGLTAIGFTLCNLANFMTALYLESAFSLGLDLNISSYNYDSNSVLEILIYVISVAVVPAFSEELLFRGVVLSGLRKYGDGLAIFVSSLLFGIFHGNFVQFPFAFIVGLVLSFTVVYTNSILPAMLIHFSNNFFSVMCDVLSTNTENWGFNGNLVDIAVYLFVIATAFVGILSLILFSRKDKKFLKLREYDGILDKKVIKRTVFTSPALIAAFLFLLAETVITHIAI